jgi:hypothetical protein
LFLFIFFIHSWLRTTPQPPVTVIAAARPITAVHQLRRNNSSRNAMQSVILRTFRRRKNAADHLLAANIAHTARIFCIEAANFTQFVQEQSDVSAGKRKTRIVFFTVCV